jgi:hypothetical protein
MAIFTREMEVKLVSQLWKPQSTGVVTDIGEFLKAY